MNTAQRRFITFWTLLLLATASLCVAAAKPSDNGGEILFSARCYYPPAQAAKPSYWRLYRVGMDGKNRQQITTGAFDDTDPHWSPDGRWVAFLRRAAVSGARGRDEPDYAAQTALCLLEIDTRKVQVIRRYTLPVALPGGWAAVWSPDGTSLAVSVGGDDNNSPSVEITPLKGSVAGAVRRIAHAYGFKWSPDSRRGIVQSDGSAASVGSGEVRDRVLEVASGREILLPAALTAFSWRDSKTLVGIIKTGVPRTLVFLNGDGTEIRRLSLAAPPGSESDEETAATATAPYPPDTARFLLYATVGGDSTGGHFNVYHRVTVATGATADFAEGKSLSWSPDGKHFCTLTGRELTDYGKKGVWTQPLLLGDGATGKTHALVSGLVYVVGAEWRPRAAP